MSGKVVRPMLSLSHQEAQRRVLRLYRSFYRYIPYIVKHHDIPKNEQNVRWKLREKFYANACVTDIRVIDLLVIKGYMELKEIRNQWQMKGHIMAHWKPSYEPLPTTFIERFLSGLD